MSKLRFILLVLMTVFLFACRSGRERTAHTGTATDRTGTNGATNGNGKAPAGTAHNLRY
ncbi:MAG TPA: hypothetical protein VGB50_02520 [Flavobacterium sp.]